MLIRYYAAAMDAAGREEEHLPVPGRSTAADLRRNLVDAHPGLDRVLTRCSLLVDGAAVTDDAAVIGTAATVDILPPFAGG